MCDTKNTGIPGNITYIYIYNIYIIIHQITLTLVFALEKKKNDFELDFKTNSS